MKFRPRHNQKDEEYYGQLTAIDFSDDPGRTLQEPAEDADINILMKRMGVKDGSALPHFTSPWAMYGDISELPEEPTELANMIHQGKLAFMRLPAELRARYGTPEDLFKFMNNDDNYDEAVKLGLLEKKKKPEPDKFDRLLDKIDTMVSSSTSSDKEPLVQGANAPKPSTEKRK